MAESLAGDGQTQAACECYQKLDNPSEELRESDDGIEELYWKTVLPGLADCYVSLDNLDPAAAIYQRVVDHYLSEVEDAVAGDADDGQYNYTDDIEDDFDSAASAATKLMSVWYKKTNFAAIRTLLESLDRTDTGYSSTRLTGVLQRSAADSTFHEQLRALVVDQSAFDFVEKMYGSAIEATSQELLLRSLALRHYRAMLNWVCGSSAEFQDRALEIWKGIIETEIPDNADSECFDMRIEACREMPKALLHRAKDLHPGSAESNSYIERLESVAERISSVIYDRNEDPELTLGRYYHLSGDEERARFVLKKRMRDVFKDWDESASGFWQHLELAHTFTALGDDVNALAAWSLLAPYPPDTVPSADDGEPVVGVPDSGPTVSKGESDGADDKDETTESDATDDDEQTTSGADANDGSEATESESDDSDATEDEDDSPTKAAPADQQNEKPVDNADEQSIGLFGWLNSVCDGCGSFWSYVDDVYCCKDCLDVQFDSKCYPKLKAGLIDRSICHPDHDHLHVPPFDEAKWKSLVVKDAVEVGGKEMSRLEWLSSIRAEWGVDRGTLEREEQEESAVAVIGQGWKAYQARKSRIDSLGPISGEAVST
jgi:tetratricopeptide (TPR) repeat protein